LIDYAFSNWSVHVGQSEKDIRIVESVFDTFENEGTRLVLDQVRDYWDGVCGKSLLHILAESGLMCLVIDAETNTDLPDSRRLLYQLTIYTANIYLELTN